MEHSILEYDSFSNEVRSVYSLCMSLNSYAQLTRLHAKKWYKIWYIQGGPKKSDLFEH